jgi:hypothetical protein
MVLGGWVWYPRRGVGRRKPGDRRQKGGEGEREREREKGVIDIWVMM